MEQVVDSTVAAPQVASVGTSQGAVGEAYARLRVSYEDDPLPGLKQRLAHLDALERMLVTHREKIAQTVSADFGARSVHETQLAEVFTVVSSIRYLKQHLKKWMQPDVRRVAFLARPARARVMYQPLGVVGIIAPWNYPFQLAVAPLAPALAAGNRVLIKPSEQAPRTGALLRELLGAIFEDSRVAVVLGDAEVAAQVARLPLDHLLFTGSSAVGRSVVRAAAENLTPVTLELGGKSPAIIHESYSVARAAHRIATGKWFNAGQTCVAPDYVLVAASQRDELIHALSARTATLYPSLGANPDYTAIVNEAHRRRLLDLIEDARTHGAHVIELNPASETLDPRTGKLVPTLLCDVTDAMRAMQEEIFGPVLPIVTYQTLDEAVAFVRARPRPLALYYFDDDRTRVQAVLDRTVSGGATINDTLAHCAVDDLPFGGVGASGTGRYHGFEGFATFSNAKSVFFQSRMNGNALMDPPYTGRTSRLLKLMIGG